MSQQDTGFRFALTAALRGNSPEFKVGAALMFHGRPVSLGWNRFRKTEPKSFNRFCNIHAETDCLNGVPYSILKRSTLFVTRITPGGRISMARPCIGCQKLLASLPIRRVFYSNFKGELMCEDFRK